MMVVTTLSLPFLWGVCVYSHSLPTHTTHTPLLPTYYSLTILSLPPKPQQSPITHYSLPISSLTLSHHTLLSPNFITHSLPSHTTLSHHATLSHHTLLSPNFVTHSLTSHTTLASLSHHICTLSPITHSIHPPSQHSHTALAHNTLLSNPSPNTHHPHSPNPHHTLPHHTSLSQHTYHTHSHHTPLTTHYTLPSHSHFHHIHSLSPNTHHTHHTHHTLSYNMQDTA